MSLSKLKEAQGSSSFSAPGGVGPLKQKDRRTETEKERRTETGEREHAVVPEGTVADSKRACLEYSKHAMLICVCGFA